MMKPIAFTAALLALTGVSVPTSVNAIADSRGIYQILGAGTFSCGSWIAASSEHYMSPVADTYQSWVLGYISAFNEFSPFGGNNISSGTDSDGMQAWITNYCAQHPVDSVMKATEELCKELIARQKH